MDKRIALFGSVALAAALGLALFGRVLSHKPSPVADPT